MMSAGTSARDVSRALTVLDVVVQFLRAAWEDGGDHFFQAEPRAALLTFATAVDAFAVDCSDDCSPPQTLVVTPRAAT